MAASAALKGDRVASVEITPSSASIAVGDTTVLSATPRDAKGAPVTGRVVTWFTSDTTIAIVSPSGTVTARGAGSATIVAKSDGKSGSAALTVTELTVPPPPPLGTRILPGQSWQAAVNANPAGTTFSIAPGMHREQSVDPKAGNTFVGEAGAVMSGARLLTQFTREGAYWVATGLTMEDAGTIECRPTHPRCNSPHTLFRDDAPLRHVASLGAVGLGTFYFDYTADKVYFADDPTGRRMEIAATRHAFIGTANDVTIRGLVIEKYANPPQHGAVSPGRFQMTGGERWTIEDNEVRHNHGEALRIWHGARLLRNKVHHNGQLGIGGPGNDALVEGNEVWANNYAGVDPNWSAGGVKVHGVSGRLSERITIRNNHVHDNDGHGLWCDFNCRGTVYEGNRVERNSGWGVFHEISYAAVVRGNTLIGNGGGVFISTSSDVEVAANTISGPVPIFALDQNRGSGFFGTLILANLNAHDNVVTLPAGADGGSIGVIQTVGNDAAFTSRNNRFTANRYTLDSAARPFAWLNGHRTAAEWNGYGHDVTGTFTP